MSLMNEPVLEAARTSVLCWLATVDADGQPNVSPKEIWAIADDEHVVVAPSYRFYPDETTEASQIASAMQMYGVKTANASRKD